jgi:HSP20 family protein
MVEKTHTAGFWPALFDPFRELGQRISDWVAPRAEASGDGDAYTVTIELPGVTADDISVECVEGALTVKGEKKAERKQEGKDYFFTEREYGAFQRSFRLPPDADQAGVAATFADGVLTLRIPKKVAAAAAARKIEVAKG